jgi:hypothetical protein
MQNRQVCPQTGSEGAGATAYQNSLCRCLNNRSASQDGAGLKGANSQPTRILAERKYRMPDLHKVLTVTCRSNVDWDYEFVSDSGKTYRLIFSLERGYECTCPGFTYRNWCKHVRSNDLCSKRCGWGEDAYANTIYDHKNCPKCGEPTHAFYVGV